MICCRRRRRRGGGGQLSDLVVSVLAFYSDDPSLNRTKIFRKAGNGPF